MNKIWFISIPVAIIVVIAALTIVSAHYTKKRYREYNREGSIAYLQNVVAKAVLKYIDNNGYPPDEIFDCPNLVEKTKSLKMEDCYGRKYTYLGQRGIDFKIVSAGYDNRYTVGYASYQLDTRDFSGDNYDYGDDIVLYYIDKKCYINPTIKFLRELGDRKGKIYS